jgi:hypothetical protein
LDLFIHFTVGMVSIVEVNDYVTICETPKTAIN